MKIQDFNYDQAFDRNIGWLTLEDQQKLKQACVAIAGVGGAGGFQAQALARLGVGKFKIADPDSFEASNMNRQLGATVETLGRPKVQVIQDMILSVNPEASIQIFSDGIDENNIQSFLEGVQVVLDGVDFYAFEVKHLLFRKSRELKIPAVTSCPLGFGASLIIFTPEGMSFEDYFDFRPQMTDQEKRLALAFGLSPTPLCLSYMNAQAFKLDKNRAASVSPGLMLVGALSATETVKIITGKGKVQACPNIYQIDLWTQRVKKKYYAQGMRSPWLRLKKWLLAKWLSRK